MASPPRELETVAVAIWADASLCYWYHYFICEYAYHI